MSDSFKFGWLLNGTSGRLVSVIFQYPIHTLIIIVLTCIIYKGLPIQIQSFSKSGFNQYEHTDENYNI